MILLLLLLLRFSFFIFLFVFNVYFLDLNKKVRNVILIPDTISSYIKGFLLSNLLKLNECWVNKLTIENVLENFSVGLHGRALCNSTVIYAAIYYCSEK